MENTNFKSSTVLIVDDNTKNLQVLGNVLREEGYRIAIAQNGYKAIEVAEKIMPSLILLDVMMPEIDGFQVCENLKSKPLTRSIPIIFLTAKIETDDIVQGFQKGGVDYITKPFRKEELIARVKTHLELQFIKQNLETTNAAKDRIFSIISHDLRSPLASFKLMLEVILNSSFDLPKEKIMASLNEFKDNIESIYNMLDNLLIWANNEMKNVAFNPVIFNLWAQLNPMIKFLNINAKSKNIELRTEINKDLKVKGDKEMVSTVFRNLLNNALKFSYKDSSIDIKAKEKGDIIEISIKDYGIGIPTDIQPQLLDNVKYYTTRGTENEKGSGIGLKICKNLAEKNGGKIWFESENEKGTTFYFTIPVEKS